MLVPPGWHILAGPGGRWPDTPCRSHDAGNITGGLELLALPFLLGQKRPGVWPKAAFISISHGEDVLARYGQMPGQPSTPGTRYSSDAMVVAWPQGYLDGRVSRCLGACTYPRPD